MKSELSFVSRQWYIGQALAGLDECSVKGGPLIGYCGWPLLDNFEWLQGYKPKFGLVALDRNTFARSVKASGVYLGKIARQIALRSGDSK